MNRNECVRVEDLEKLKKLSEILEHLSEIPFNEMRNLAKVEMRKTLWRDLGNHSGENYMTEQIQRLETAFYLLKNSVRPEYLNQLEEELENSED